MSLILDATVYRETILRNRTDLWWIRSEALEPKTLPHRSQVNLRFSVKTKVRALSRRNTGDEPDKTFQLAINIRYEKLWFSIVLKKFNFQIGTRSPVLRAATKSSPSIPLMHLSPLTIHHLCHLFMHPPTLTYLCSCAS